MGDKGRRTGSRRKDISDEVGTQNWMPMLEADDGENTTSAGPDGLARFVSHRKNRMFPRGA